MGLVSSVPVEVGADFLQRFSHRRSVPSVPLGVPQVFLDFNYSCKLLVFRYLRSGGKGIRTPGLLIANETLYQLSYTPTIEERQIFQVFGRGKRFLLLCAWPALFIT